MAIHFFYIHTLNIEHCSAVVQTHRQLKNLLQNLEQRCIVILTVPNIQNQVFNVPVGDHTESDLL